MPTLNTNNLMLVIKARDEAAKVLKSVEGQLQQIVKAAEAANEAMAQIAASGAIEASQNAMAAVQSAGASGVITTPPKVDIVQTLGNFKADVIAQELSFLEGPLSTIIGKYQELRAEHPLVVGGLTKAGLAANFLGVNAGQLLGPLGDAANIIQVLGGRLTDAGPPFNNMGGRLARIGVAAGTAVGPLQALASGGLTRLAALGAALIPVIRGVGAALMTVALSPVGLIVTALAGLVAAGVLVWQNWDTISAKATEIWNWIQGFLGGVMDGITSKFSEVWEGVKTFFSGIWEGLIGIVTENWDKILAVIFPVVGLPVLIAKNWGAITEKVGEIWGAVVGTVQEWWNNLIGVIFPEEGGLLVRFQELFSGVMTWFDENVLGFFTSLPDRIGELVSGIADVVSAPFAAAFGALRGFINKIVDAVNSFPSFEIPKFLPMGGTKFSLPKLPRVPDFEFAEGGILRRPIVALAEREPEVIAPLSALGRMLPAGAGGGAPVIQVINRGNIVTERQLEDVIVKAYHRAARLGRI